MTDGPKKPARAVGKWGDTEQTVTFTATQSEVAKPNNDEQQSAFDQDILSSLGL